MYQKLLQYHLEIEEFLPQSKGHESHEKQPSKPENVQPTKDLPSETMVGEEAHKPESVQHEEVVQIEQYTHDTDSNKSEKLRNSRETMPSTTSESGGSHHTKKVILVTVKLENNSY